jgi:hypothetical protein
MPGNNNSIKRNIKCIKTIDNEAMTEDLAKCTLSHVQNVERKQKYLSNLMDPVRYIVGSAIRNIDQKDIRKKSDLIFTILFFKYLLFFITNID